MRSIQPAESPSVLPSMQRLDLRTSDPDPYDRRVWQRRSQERAVEGFYGRGVERYGDYHGGMLNFGLWTGGVRDYLSASRNLISRVARGVSLSPESRLLDVACGMGAQDVFFAREFGCRSIDGLDVTWGHVAAARRRARAAQLEGSLRFHHGSAVAIPFDDASFTHVICIEGGPHFDTRERFLCEAQRVLGPGGRLGLADYTIKRPLGSTFERACVEIARRAWHVPLANVHDAAEFRAKLERAGFRDVRIEESGADVIPGYCRESRRPENLREMYAIRGYWTTRASLWLDRFVHLLFVRGILDYAFVFATKRR